jgi:hypothetical protein
MNKSTCWVVLIWAILGAGCAHTEYATGRKSALKMEMPAPGKAKVVFVRPGQFAGAGITFAVHDETRLIGILPNKSFFEYECEPGHHIFSTSMENLTFLEADLLADHIYYAKVSASMGAWIARVNMYSLHPGCAGDLWPKMPSILRSLEQTTVNPGTIEHDATGAANYAERLAKYRAEPQAKGEAILPEHGQASPVAVN